MKHGVALIAFAALAGCDIQRVKKADPNDAPTSTAAPAACAEGWTVRLDEPGFVAGNFPSARLDDFLATSAAAAARAANEACAAGQLDSAAATAIKTLTIASISDKGAPLFSADNAAAAARVEWNFVARDLTIPSDMEWRTGLACAIDVGSSLCPDGSA